MLLLSAVVVVGLGLGAFIASITTPSGTRIQSVAFAQGGTFSAQGQTGANRAGAGGFGQTGANGQGAAGSQGSAPLFGSVTARDGNTLTVSSQQGEKKVNLSGAKLQKTVDGTIDDLKAGETVMITGQEGQDGVFTASSIQIRPNGPTAGQGTTADQGGRGQTQRQAQGQNQTQDQGQSRATRPVVGSISSVNGDTATVSTQQGDVKVKISGAKIQKTVDATVGDLQAGERVVVTGQQGQDGSYTANSVQIVQELAQGGQAPTTQPSQTPTPTPNQTPAAQPSQGSKP